MKNPFSAVKSNFTTTATCTAPHQHTQACEMVKDKGWGVSGDRIVAVHGTMEGRPGATNLCRVLEIP